MVEPLLFLMGLSVATICSLVGLGGGALYVPILVLIFGLTTQRAVGVSLMAMTFTTISAAIAYARQRRIDYKVGLLLDAFDVPGALFGAFVTTLLSSTILASLFGCFLLPVSICIIRKRDEANGGRGVRCGDFNLSLRTVCFCFLASFASGVVAGMFGAGGGIVDETVMILLLGMAPHIAVGTSEFGMALTNAAALVPHALFGNVVLREAAPVAAGAVVGAQLGPAISRAMKTATLRKILGATLFVIGLRMLMVPYII